MSKAMMILIKNTQLSAFNDDINKFKNNMPLNCKSRLKDLHPFLDSNDLIRVGGGLVVPI